MYILINYNKIDIDLIVLATTTPDNTFPSTATLVQKKLEIDAVSFDIQAVCAGFVFALSVAKSMMIEGMYKNCLVIGVSKKNPGELQARTENNRVVNFATDANVVGKFVNLKIVDQLTNSLRGKLERF